MCSTVKISKRILAKGLLYKYGIKKQGRDRFMWEFIPSKEPNGKSESRILKVQPGRLKKSSGLYDMMD
jgi:hypothetical protein